MAERLKAFLKDVSSLREQRGAEQSARLDRLKTMTAEQFVRVPREDLQDLTDQQYTEIVRHVASDHRLPELQEVIAKSDKSWFGLRRIAIPTAVRAIVFGLTTGLLVLILSLAIGPAMEWWQYRTPPLRSQATVTWPRCHRLDGWVDGCTYVPVRDMAWERAANLLGIPESELRNVNRHIAQAYIPAQATLIVWRYRTQLYRSTQ